jgi:hypothetical protein
MVKNKTLREIIQSIPTHRLKEWGIKATEIGYVDRKPDYRSRKAVIECLLQLNDSQVMNIMELTNSL